MNTTINAVCYKSKTLKNGEHPIMLRIYQRGKLKYVSLKLSILARDWDFKTNTPKSSHPNKEYIQKIILDKILEYQTQVLNFKANNKNFTATTLIESTEQKTQIKTVDEFYKELIAHYKSIGKIGNANIYRDSYNSLKTFKKTNNLDFLFSEIDLAWLNKYEKWLISCNRAETTMSLLFRTLRSAFNKAIEQQIAKREDYPFNEFRMSKFSSKTKKRSITKAEIKRILNLDLSSESKSLILSRDIFIFSYLQSGINFTDIANLKYENIQNGRIQYIRQKTKRLINIAIQEEVQRIIDKYSIDNAKANDYILPILDRKTHKTEQQKYNRIQKVLGQVNRNLKIIGQRAKIDITLTTYVARHSYATILKRSGVNTTIISESLGHSSEKVTQIYLDSFENSQIDEAMKNLL